MFPAEDSGWWHRDIQNLDMRCQTEGPGVSMKQDLTEPCTDTWPAHKTLKCDAPHSPPVAISAITVLFSPQVPQADEKDKITVLPRTSCVTPGESPHFSELWGSHLYHGGAENPHLKTWFLN